MIRPWWKGRVSARGLGTIVSLALCLFGTVRLGAGAIVPTKAIVAQLLLERAFDRSVATHRPQRPWPWADMAPAARITIPRLGVTRIVLDTGSGQAMAFGPTLLPGGARIGAPGTAVLAAHRDTHFGFLQRVRAGDAIDVALPTGGIRHYRVTDMAIVRWDRFAIADTMESRLALTTCFPFGAIDHGPLRYVVRASLIQQGGAAGA